MSLCCDLFCRVVDNLGDAGVCWRLARQLAKEYSWSMRLWIDDPTPLAGLRPGVNPLLPVQIVDGVEIRLWPKSFPDVAPGDVIIEAFACELPLSFVTEMAAKPKAPVWLNLEYLSAEDWVAGCHGLPSPHPTLGLNKHFFFPGFVPGTGGLLREAMLPESTRRATRPELLVSLFCYDNPALPHLLDAWAAGTRPVLCQVAEGLARRQVEDWLGETLPCGSQADRSSLKIEATPFLPQDDYDRLLASADINFVRGEDSFVRAQWAEHAFVWQAYPQAEGAHWTKLEAFLDRYCRTMPEEARLSVAGLWRAWNGQGNITTAWPLFLQSLPAIETQGAAWAVEIRHHGDLAENLVRFCHQRI